MSKGKGIGSAPQQEAAAEESSEEFKGLVKAWKHLGIKDKSINQNWKIVCDAQTFLVMPYQLRIHGLYQLQFLSFFLSFVSYFGVEWFCTGLD